MHIQVVWWTKWNLFARTIHFAWANSLNGSWWVWLLKSALNMLILPVSIHNYAHDKLIPTSFIEASLHVVTQKALCRNNTHTIVMKVFRTNVYMQLGHCINYFNVLEIFLNKNFTNYGCGTVQLNQLHGTNQSSYCCHATTVHTKELMMRYK